ncbi:hypothetical protein XFF6992_530097 [Xanthomonas citri pv. fuscans]|nr:hypothetical protein XFF6992_530097 [Xanthomonas citri pv. fuscans]SOO35391.1 hypothetical protein XFF6994_5280007 [Xanthomonas citri pv. fuscans]
MSLVRPGPWQRGSGFFYFGVGATDADGPQPPGSKKMLADTGRSCAPTAWCQVMHRVMRATAAAGMDVQACSQGRARRATC